MQALTSSFYRSWRTTLIGGAVFVVALALLSAVGERIRFGADDQAAIAKVQAEVRERFARDEAELTTMAEALVAERLRLSAESTTAMARPLFDAAQRTLERADDPGAAVAVYDETGGVLAWAGAPSPLPVSALRSPAAFMAAPVPLGTRLVAVQPIVDGAGRRLGVAAAERVVSSSGGARPAVTDQVTIATSLGPVTLATRAEGASENADPFTFVVSSRSNGLLLSARIDPAAPGRARQAWRDGVRDLQLAALALTSLLLVAPLLRRRAAATSAFPLLAHSAGVLACVLIARLLLWLALPESWIETSGPFDPDSHLSRLLGAAPRSSFDFLLTALACAAALALVGDAIERGRRAGRLTRQAPDAGAGARVRFILTQLAVAAVAAVVVLGYQVFLGDTIHNPTIDLLSFSLWPWEASRLALAFGLVVMHAVTFWSAAALYRLGLSRWRVRARGGALLALVSLWSAPLLLLVWAARDADWRAPTMATLAIGLLSMLAATWAPRLTSRVRRGPQALRLAYFAAAVMAPSLAWYPSLATTAEQAQRHLIENEYSPLVLRHIDELKRIRNASLQQIDQLTSLGDRSLSIRRVRQPPMSALNIWNITELGRRRLTSAIEVYDRSGALESRFALNLPEYNTADRTWGEGPLAWQTFSETERIDWEERRMLRAVRALTRDRRGESDVTGTIVVHVMIEYDSLPFIAPQKAYLQLLRGEAAPRPVRADRDVQLVVYSWGRLGIYASGDVWPLDEPLFTRLTQSRTPFWTQLSRDGRTSNVYFANDRFGIYALGYPVMGPFQHLKLIAELATLAGAVSAVLLVGAALFTALAGRTDASGRALWREIRASFYRKLFLAFVLASVIPVLTLSFVIRTYVAGQLRARAEQEAAKIAAVAQRAIEDFTALQSPGDGAFGPPDDDLLVWVSRIINQDVNIFAGTRLVATSERDLFDSGLLPTSVPGQVFRAIAIDRSPSVVNTDTVGGFPYTLAAAPVNVPPDPRLSDVERNHILTVPLSQRQPEVTRELEELDRNLHLAAVAFILLGALVGYRMAERIADPVNRLTRATRRIARGDLDARIAVTSADELRRLVEDFNRMAVELQQQRVQLEHTNRLKAWAEMARQVAHEIKNPLTPIQLSAEHLLRVHRDRGEPLGPVVDSCVTAILKQVKLLRGIVGEFASFASSPVARPVVTRTADLLKEILDPYRVGLTDKMTINVDAPDTLPAIFVDRTLIGRALTNIIENALQAMPDRGAVRIAAEQLDSRVVIRVADEGPGMSPETLQNVFEPFFSTKVSGTGLGLPIAKRNVELNGGSIDVASQPGVGTTVSIALPIADGDSAPASSSNSIA